MDWSKGGRGQWTGDGDSTTEATQQTTGKSDGADKSGRQHARYWGRANGATRPPLATTRAERGGEGGVVGGRRGGGAADRMCGAVAPAAMGAEAALLGQEGLPKKPGGGGRVQWTFWACRDRPNWPGLSPLPRE